MKKSKKELEDANEELKQIWVEIEENEMDGEKVIIERIHEGDLDGKNKMIFIQKEGEDGELKDVHILKIPCDPENGEMHDKVFIKKIEISEDGDSENIEWNEKTPAPGDDELNINTEDNKKGNTTEDYRLGVNDFKLFPNPTNNKVTVSFQLTDPGPVDIKLLDTSGRLVAEANINSESGFVNQEFNIEGRSRGTYLMQIKQGEKWRHEKVVLK